MTDVTWMEKAILIVGSVIGIGGTVAAGGGFIMSRHYHPPSQSTMEHRVDLLEQDVGHLEERVVRLENVLAEVLTVQTALSARTVEEKAAPIEVKPGDAPPVSVSVSSTPPVPPVRALSVKRKPAVRHQAPQGADYPQMRQPYPWSEWENPAPEQQ